MSGRMRFDKCLRRAVGSGAEMNADFSHDRVGAGLGASRLTGGLATMLESPVSGRTPTKWQF